MEPTIRFKDVVQGVSLDAQTAQHVLRTPDILSDMPETGGRGVRRNFTLRQALRLAICANLVNAGLTVAVASEVVTLCEKLAKRMRIPMRGVRQFSGEILDPWILTVDERRYCRLWCERWGRDTLPDNDVEFIDIRESNKKVTREVPPLLRVQLNLTELEHRIWLRFPSDD